MLVHLRSRQSRLSAVAIILVLAAGAAMFAYGPSRSDGTSKAISDVTGNLVRPVGGIASFEEGISGVIDLTPGTFAFVTVWSEVENVEYAVQLVGLSGPFQLVVSHDIPNGPGEYKARLWVVSASAAEFIQTHWPDPVEGCARGFSGLDMQRSAVEGDPVRLLDEALIQHGAGGIDRYETTGNVC